MLKIKDKPLDKTMMMFTSKDNKPELCCYMKNQFI